MEEQNGESPREITWAWLAGDVNKGIHLSKVVHSVDQG